MDSKTYVRERMEELRSRISLLQSTATRLKQNYWTVFKEYFSQKKSPPFIFPTRAFNKIDELFGLLNLDFDPDNRHYALIFGLNDVDGICNNLLVELNKLQEALDQRIIGLGIMKGLEAHPIRQVESCVLPKVYCAVDAIIFDLMKAALGKDWIKKEKYIPISLLDSQTGGYTVNPVTLLITAPYHDSFRARFWPAISHEVAHILFNELIDTPGPFLNTVFHGAKALKDIFTSYSTTSLYAINWQITELTSDIISCYICPASYLSAAINLDINVDKVERPIFKTCPMGTHPPIDVRLFAMETVLDRTGIRNECKPIERMIESINRFLFRRRLIFKYDESDQLLLDYAHFAKIYSMLIMDKLSSIGLNAFDRTTWKSCHDALTAGDSGVTPTKILAMDWIKRIFTVKGDNNLKIEDYFKKREREPKMFEWTVHNLYTSYEQIVEKTKEECIFDVFIDFD